jgi:hypothetical protein
MGYSYFQCQDESQGAKCAMKVDILNHIFIDFYIPALTPYFNNTEASPQHSENITFFVICHIYTGVNSKEN